ncbi:dTDP-6-deoxy-L-talose 4-dehydrogenase (NAD+) [Lachnospiraceae bacterium NE2001]|nr:dTDP-6-deoxy-L-talose 4-dehydrogenase (NAD+) [Lachnospiraceae bacterium NE2001]
MKILITGANGYLGQGIVRSVLDAGHDVVATDFSVQNIDDRAQKVSCDIFDVKNPYDYFNKPDVLLHLAWRDGFVHYSNAHIEDINKHYEFIRTFAQTDVKKIAIMGSMHEIGFYEGSINSNTPCNPVTPYGISKNALRQLSEMICKKEKKMFQWLRGYYIVGTNVYGSSIFSKITAAELRGDTSFPFTMGQNQFDFLDYDVFCLYVAKVVVQNEIEGIINICSGHPEKLADRVERFIKENGYSIRLKYGEFPDRPYDSKAVWGDSRKLEAIISNGN